MSSQQPFREPLLLVQREALTPEQGARWLAEVEIAGLIPVFIPHVLENPPLSGLITDDTSLEALIAGFQRGDVSPTRDDSPFFYEFASRLPSALRSLVWGLGLLVVLGVGYLIVQRRRVRGQFWAPVGVFGALGAGFLLVEAGVIQRWTLFLGYPTFTLGLVLFALLLGAGLGSWMSDRMRGISPWCLAAYAGVGAALFAVVYAAVVPILTSSALGLPLPVRAGIAAALVLPAGVLMGIPFPNGLRAIRSDLIPLGWGVNGAASVVGGVAAMAVAILFGFRFVLLAGGVLYLCAAALAWRLFEKT